MANEVIAFVHAKGHSARLPGKNLRVLGDLPLFCHALDSALRSMRVSAVVIDSDSDEILAIGRKRGAIPLRRPTVLATNETTGDDLAAWQAHSFPNAEIVLQVVPTSPFLAPSSIDGAIDLLRSSSVDSVVGVRAEPLYLWHDGRPSYFSADGRIPNSNELAPSVYETTGLYVNRADFVRRQRRRMNPESCTPFLLSRLEAIDINTAEDFQFAEWIWRGLRTL